eukprot:15431715-Alexandrium_andersonii.AAC.1
MSKTWKNQRCRHGALRTCHGPVGGATPRNCTSTGAASATRARASSSMSGTEYTALGTSTRRK